MNLSPLAVAVWFMDDGAADHAGLTLQTHGFERREVDLLVAALEERFGLATNPRSNKGRWLIYIRARSLRRFAELVEPHLLAELSYKLLPRRSRTP